MRSLVVLGFAACALAACAARPASAPSSANHPEPDTVEAAQAQIDDARRALGVPAAASIAPSTPGAAAGGSVADAPPPSPPPPPPPADAQKKSSTPAAPSGGEAEPDATQNPCVSSCQAIRSMRRAVAALCRIAGDDDARCSDAKRTLDASEQRVASCGC